MNTKMTRQPAIALLLCLVLISQPVMAGADGPLTFEGTLTNAAYRIRVPVHWNGTLLVYAHGYAPTAPDAVAGPGGEAAENLLLAQGYALAGSAYRNGGWAVKEGTQNTLALTNFFRGKVGNPQYIILWGNSMGSVIALNSIEKYPGIYNGAVGECAIGAGATGIADWFLALRLAYAVTFGWPTAWGTVGDVRDDINFNREVVPVLLNQLSDPNNIGKFEFIRMVNDIPYADFYAGNLMLFQDMFLATAGIGEAEARAGGPIAQNLNHLYRLDPAEQAHLRDNFGLSIPTTDALLAAMNGQRTIEAQRSARNYISHYADYTGDLKRPVLTMHTVSDGLVLVSQESAYRNTVEAAGKSDLLLQTYTNAVGHCNFTPEQIVRAVSAMDSWLRTGAKPDATYFSEDLGFVANFEPPAWLYPVTPNEVRSAAAQDKLDSQDRLTDADGAGAERANTRIEGETAGASKSVYLPLVNR